jgi:3-oxoadipate CoA-transferase beta subunit
VSAQDDLANWHTGKPGDILAVGGAMETFVMMTLLTRGGNPKLVPECSSPLTGPACVTRVYTDLTVFLIRPDAVVVRDLFGVDHGAPTSVLDVPLIDQTQKAAP